MTFKDRTHAGKQLAEKLKKYKDQNSIVLSLPRGGVSVGYEVAKVLDAPHDVIVVRKLGVPGRPEFAMGAIAPGNTRVLHEDKVQQLGITESQVMQVENEEREEMQRRIQRYRDDRPRLNLSGKTVIVVDDGLATGATAEAAVMYANSLGPEKLVLAVPVGAPDSVKRLQGMVDDLICLNTPTMFMAVGQWYEVFDQTTDEEVIRILEESVER